MQIFPTRMCNVTVWRHSRLRSHWLMALVAGGWGGILREYQRLLSLIGYGSSGGVCGRRLTAGKVLFTGRQICSLYLVLWLCVLFLLWCSSQKNSRYLSSGHSPPSIMSLVSFRPIKNIFKDEVSVELLSEEQ